MIHEPFGLKDLVKFGLLVDALLAQRVGERLDNRNDLQAVCVLDTGVQLPCLLEVLARHQVVFRVHAQDALTQVLVEDCGFRWRFQLFYVSDSLFVFFDCDQTVGSVSQRGFEQRLGFFEEV